MIDYIKFSSLISRTQPMSQVQDLIVRDLNLLGTRVSLSYARALLIDYRIVSIDDINKQ